MFSPSLLAAPLAPPARHTLARPAPLMAHVSLITVSPYSEHSAQYEHVKRQFLIIAETAHPPWLVASIIRQGDRRGESKISASRISKNRFSA